MRLKLLPAITILLLAPAVGLSQLPVTEIQVRTDPADARVRPLESLVVQVLAYGVIAEGDEDETVRLQRNGATFELADSQAGWLSKPFRFQGEEDEPFYQERGRGLAAILLGQATGDFVLKDAVLFTASERTGRYRVNVSLEGKQASVEIEVSNTAPARRPRETTYFQQEPSSRDRYRRLAEHYAPFVAQETWFQPKSDYLARFDLDGDWQGDNNWERAEEGSSQAYVYYAAMETETHWFLIYNFFHPRDYSDKCIAGTCHENDNEGLILTIQKDGSAFGRLQTMETLAHNNIYSYREDRRIRNAVHSFDGHVELFEDSHPVVFIESGGHGVYGSEDSHSRFSLRSNDFSEGTGVTYVYKGKAERPRHPDDRDVGYQLLPIYEHWWLRAHNGERRRDRTFDDYYVYQPFGRRPRPKYPEIAGSFLGREYGANKAKPFWGWHDRRTRKRDVVATGQWGLDPAYAVSQNLRFPGRFSLRYVFNPYLGIGEPSVLDTVSSGTAAPPEQPSAAPPSPVGTGQPSGSLLTSFEPPRSKDYDPRSQEGQFDVRMHVDGEIDVFIQGSVVRYAVLNGKPPVDDGSEFSQPIPRANFRRFELDKKDGRGKITLLEAPSPANDFTVKFRISDPRGDDDRYHARLRWEWDNKGSVTSAPQPADRPISAPSLPADPRAAGQGTQRQATPARDRVLEKHREAILRGPASEAPVEPQRSPDVAAQPNLPGVEIHSDDNDPRRYDGRNEGLFEFRGRIDGTVRFRIRGDRVLAENVTGRPVEVERFSFSQPVPASRVREISVERKDGRGKVVLLERPWEGNHFMAVVEVTDPKGGDDRYHFRLTWEQ